MSWTYTFTTASVKLAAWRLRAGLRVARRGRALLAAGRLGRVRFA
jgi:hypothetical protein